ncbi:MAG: ornithine--oxo-acid transaminase [Deltaproteobacteria bacterium]|nr:MAG: ornithine--oxo-acid transaminase [Deltaproteobacteria bacterium]
MATSRDYMNLEDQYGAHNYKPMPVVLSEGEGAWVTDVEGKRYLDMLSAYSALNFGHRHPKLVAAMKDQLDRLTLTSRAFFSDKLGLWYKALTDLCELDMAIPMNTGAEAVETAIKIVRKWGYQHKKVPKDQAEILVCEQNFHGRTISIISFSTEPEYKEDFGPLTPGFRSIPYGDADALEAAITPNTVGFLVEPIQGEGGVNVPPEGYLQRAREICDRNNVLLMVDEIQTGLGRTGRNFCYQHDGIKPDVLILGKALGGGLYPISAVVTKEEVLSLFQPGQHGSTFGGNPLACAVSLEAMRILQEEKLAERAASMGDQLQSHLRSLSSPVLQDIRGKGLLIGVEIKSSVSKAKPYGLALVEEGILCKETQEHTLRFAPSLLMTQEDLDWALPKISRVLTSTPAQLREYKASSHAA